MLLNAYMSVFGRKINDAELVRNTISVMFNEDVKTLSDRLSDDELIAIANNVKAKKGGDFFNEITLFCTAIAIKAAEKRQFAAI